MERNEIESYSEYSKECLIVSNAGKVAQATNFATFLIFVSIFSFKNRDSVTTIAISLIYRFFIQVTLPYASLRSIGTITSS